MDTDNNAFIKLKDLAESLIVEKYEIERAEIAYQRMRQELEYVRKHDKSQLYLLAYEALKAVEALPREYRLMGSLPSSVLLYVLGVSYIDPVGSIPRLYPEMCFGLNGAKAPNIDTCVCPNLYTRLIQHFNDCAGERRMGFKRMEDGRIYGVEISKSNLSGNYINAGEGCWYNFIPVEERNHVELAEELGRIYYQVRPETYSELVKCWGLMAGEGTWSSNGESLYLDQGVEFNDLIAHREDIYEYMMLHGIKREMAYSIAESVYMGRIYHNGWDAETLSVMEKSGIPEWYPESCRKIKSLSSRGHSMMSMRFNCV